MPEIGERGVIRRKTCVGIVLMLEKFSSIDDVYAIP